MLSQQHRFYPADHPSAQQPYDSEDISLFYSPVPTFYPHKRIKVSAHLDLTAGILPSPRDCSSLVFHSAMPAPPAFARPSHPAVSFHRASEPPASPATIASTLSNHSTPAPSPPCLTIRSDNHSPTDFPLIDDAYPLHEQHPKPPLDPRYHQHYNAAFAGYQHAPVPAPAPAPASSTSSPWSSPYTSQQQQQLQRQQYYHHAMPAYNGNSSYGARCSDPRPSVSDVNMPATPVHSPVHRENGGCGAVQHPPPPPSSSSSISHSGPSLSRTVSDAMQDELYNPGIAPGIAHSRPEHPTDLSGSRLPDLLQQAQNQHAMACSPPASASFGGAAYNLAQSRRQREADHEAKALQKKIKPEFDPPKTISPKDAYNEYHEPDGPESGEAIRGSLFSNGDAYPQHGRTDIDIKSESDGSLPDDVDDDEYEDDDDGHSYDGHSYDGHSNYDGMTTSRRHSDVVMEDYMYGAGDSAQPRYGDRLTVPGSTYPQWAGEEGSSSQAGGASSDETYDHHQQHHHHHHHHNHHHPQPLQRPEDTKANDGAYSCTVHGCTRRFSTANKMSKHRREVHRPSTPLSRDAITGAPTKSLLQGPSRCARINPTTGKPCNTIFSRPYDLTRHEDTIHNTARQKVRCEICTDDKTFSRQDALTRHKKVKHGIDKAP